MFSSGKYTILYKILTALFRDTEEKQAFYELISVVEFQGSLTRTGESFGHYICDVKENTSNLWFRTNDNRDPVEISVSNVSKKGYVYLYKRISSL